MVEKYKQKKVVIISGATGYLGSETARRLSQEGFCIAALYHNASEQVVTDFLNNLSGFGHKTYQCHLEDPYDIENTIEIIKQRQGIPYACIHAAWKKPKRKQLDLCTSKEISAELNENVLNSFNLFSMCAKVFRQQKEGVIIGITTAGVILPQATHLLGSYIVGKYAIQGMLAVFREELSPFNVEVYSVAPGFMPGGINKDLPSAFIEMVRQKSLHKKIAEASDIASAIATIFSGKVKDEKNMTILIAPEYDSI